MGRRVVFLISIFLCALAQQAKAGRDSELIAAARGGQTQKVKELIAAGANPNAVDLDGSTALTIAARDGRLEMARAVIQAGANVQRNRPYNALRFASRGGHLKVVKLLVKAGAPVDARDTDGKTALIEAAKEGHASVVKSLITASANVNSEVRSRYQAAGRGSRYTALSLAAARGHSEVVRSLSLSGADVNFDDGAGRTPLMDAAERGRLETIEILLRAGADLKARDKSGWSACMRAAVGKKVAAVVRLMREPGEAASLINVVAGTGASRIYAVRALAMAKERKAVIPLTAQLKKEQDPDVIKHIIRALGEIGDPSAAEALIPFVIHENEDYVRVAGKALSLLKVQRAIPELRRAVWDRRRSRRIASVMQSVDMDYYRGVRKMLTKISLILLVVIILAPALLSLLLARDKKVWLLRLVAAAINGTLAYHLGLYAGVLGSSILFEGGGASHGPPVYLFFYGFYCAYFCALGTMVRVGGARTWAGALVLGVLPMACIPLLFWGFLSAPWESWSMGTPELLKIVVSVAPISLLVFVDYLLVSRLIKPILDRGGESGLDRMGWRGVGGMLAVMGASCMLPLPLTRLVMAILH